MSKKKHRKRTRQIAALAYRADETGALRVLLISSRETGRPVIPKGWPMRGRSDAKAAAIEAEEEAGVRGTVSKKPIGRYNYWKRLKTHFRLVRVDVYALEVTRMVEHYKEEGIRRMVWLEPDEAAGVVDDPELATLIRSAVLPVAKA